MGTPLSPQRFSFPFLPSLLCFHNFSPSFPEGKMLSSEGLSPPVPVTRLLTGTLLQIGGPQGKKVVGPGPTGITRENLKDMVPVSPTLPQHEYGLRSCTGHQGFPGGSAAKNPPANAGDMGSIPGSGRPPREGNGNPLQYTSLGNPRDRGAWQSTICGVTKESDRT